MESENYSMIKYDFPISSHCKWGGSCWDTGAGSAPGTEMMRDCTSCPGQLPVVEVFFTLKQVFSGWWIFLWFFVCFACGFGCCGFFSWFFSWLGFLFLVFVCVVLLLFLVGWLGFFLVVWVVWFCLFFPLMPPQTMQCLSWNLWLEPGGFQGSEGHTGFPITCATKVAQLQILTSLLVSSGFIQEPWSWLFLVRCGGMGTVLLCMSWADVPEPVRSDTAFLYFYEAQFWSISVLAAWLPQADADAARARRILSPSLV